MDINRATQTAAAGAIVLSMSLTGCGGGSGSTSSESSPAAPAETSNETTGGESTASTESSGGTGTAASGLGPDADLSKESPSVAPQDAITAAQTEVGKGTVTSIELDFNEREKIWQYEVKVQDGSTENDVEVDAESGEVRSTEKDDTDDPVTPIDLEKPMTYDEALELAKKKGSGRLEGWKLEHDNKRTEYQFDFDDQGRELEIAVDVDSKKVTVDD
ncbi:MULTISPECIES: PepSY domain-containing protein [Brevibacterium]|nr:MULTISPECIES: PepSY domain-containing protein [Brevibacterium]